MRDTVNNPALDPSPFRLDGSPDLPAKEKTGILLIHGYTGAPTELRLVGEDLARQGFLVAAPLLPGHGTSYEDLNGRRWREWTDCAETALEALRTDCGPLLAAGLSLGSLLALHLAATRSRLAGVVAWSPPLWVRNRFLPLAPLLRYFVAALPKRAGTDLADPEGPGRLRSYTVDPVGAAAEVRAFQKVVRRELPSITCPALVMAGSADRTIHPKSPVRTLAGLGSRERTLLLLEGSGHCITVDRDWPLVAARTGDFARSLGAGVRS